MNTANLKKYGPQARRDFIEAVRDRAAYYGLTADEVLPLKVDGEAAIIGGRHFPVSIEGKRKKLEDRIKSVGFDRVIDAIAYTWFNRLVAIRYMELHGYLDHGYRILSHPEGRTNPEIVAHAEHLDLPGLANDTVVDLMLAGDKDSELYRLILIAQCNALSRAMPFLFERVDDESELLLPENLLKSDSLVRRLVAGVPEDDWQNIEVIGWLYQFYMTDEKTRIEKYSKKSAVKGHDIPGKTQLFTPNWIVKYMVQNSLGAQWLATYPDSKLTEQMEYCIVPSEQSEEVNSRVAAITPASLNPEELTLIDPACGSGHILVEAYDLFKAIYLERGYRQKDLPKLILEKNLFGLEIDERATQMAGFALMMKGRADERQLLSLDVKLNLMTLANSAVFDAVQLSRSVRLKDYELDLETVEALKRVFEHCEVFGSLIRIPKELQASLPALRRLSESHSNDLFLTDTLRQLGRLVSQAELLSSEYDAVVANPPYMHNKKMNVQLKDFVKDKRNYPSTKTDLYACFVERGYSLAKPHGHIAMVTMQNWMFLSSFEEMRERLLLEKTICTMTQIGYNSFPSMNSKIARATVFSVWNAKIDDYLGTFVNLNSAPQTADKREVFLGRDPANLFAVSADEFGRIPGSPLAYWASPIMRRIFETCRPLEDFGDIGKGLDTGANELFLRRWHETDRENPKWVGYLKGGPWRKWYGNQDYVVDWSEEGNKLRSFPKSNMRNAHNYKKPGITWTKISSSLPAFRDFGEGFVFDTTGPCVFTESISQSVAIAFLNSAPAVAFLEYLSPTLDFQSGHISKLPVQQNLIGKTDLSASSKYCIQETKIDWDSYERSWNFQSLPILKADSDSSPTLESSYECWIAKNIEITAEVKRLEEENNRHFIEVYGLHEELSPLVPTEQVTLTVNPEFRYGDKLEQEEQWARFRQDTMQELVSFGIGCMMGRYSLDFPGLVYARSRNVGFEPGRYASFPADDDGIIPLTDTEWFDDDATHRMEEFLSVAWSKDQLETNLTFLAENLGSKKGESCRATLRRYISQSFFNDHCQTYSVKGGGKRPIYWLFTSGENKALECLVYLHRYNEGTLSRMRTEYVIPLQGKVASRISQLSDDIGAATSTSHRKKLQKRHDVLIKHREELRAFDEKLRHYADQRIHLDLDDGVKVNYGKFGDLLANVKDITGKKPVKA